MRYLPFDELLDACRDLAERAPRWVRLSEAGRSRHGRPIPLLTVTDHTGSPDALPGFWLDGGTHAAEWTGVMAALHTATRWVEALEAGDAKVEARFRRCVAYVSPCISPDGYDALMRGAPYLRSTLRPPRDGQPRRGLDPCDVDGDGRIAWMRWRHPAGPWAFDGDLPRHRRLDDPASEAWFLAPEGVFLAWDHVSWVMAPRMHGLDLNRNFPGAWAPFSMFGMDGGDFPLSEPESRAIVETFRARPRIGAALTNHTYTGALLTQPYRDPCPLPDADVELMEALGREAVHGTGYRVVRTLPDFTYDPKRAIVGVWSDTLSTTFGVPGYTLELWDPFAWAGVPNPNPGKFWTRPDPAQVHAMLTFLQGAGMLPWKRVEHPQLGEVDVGGVDLVRTLHNPPEALLGAECERGFQVADHLLRALPEVHARLHVSPVEPGVRMVHLVLENRGYLSTSGLAHARTLGLGPPVVATVDVEPVVGERAQVLGWLDGWGAAQVASARHALYPGLPDSGGPTADARWLVRGDGPVTVVWDAGRGGRGTVSAG